MKTFRQHLNEAAANLHMIHTEDDLFRGVDAARSAINQLRNARDLLAGNTTKPASMTAKWDGAPAIICGKDPSDGQFFIAKKGLFNKNPKLYKSEAEIRADLSGDLADKFLIAFKHFKKLNPRGIFQGDLMFTKSDLKKVTIKGEEYITFQPNTIVYAVPVNSDMAKLIKKAEVGIVWHTTYTGDSFDKLEASFGHSIVDKLTRTSSVWMDDATLRDESGTATFPKADSDEVTAVLSDVGKIFSRIGTTAIKEIAANETLRIHIETYNNSKIRAGETISDVKAHVDGLISFIHDKYQKEIDSKKTEKGKASWEAQRTELMKFFSVDNKVQLLDLFKMYVLIIKAKEMIVNKLDKASKLPTFLRTKTGYIPTKPEGYVIIDHLTGNARKIVARGEFSAANFNASGDILRGWEK